MAGKHDGDAVVVHHCSDRAGRLRMPDAACELPVGRGLAVWHSRELIEDGDGEGRESAQVELQVERPAATLEVLVELAPGTVDAPRRSEDAWAGDSCEPLEPVARIVVERDRGEAAVRRSDEEFADRGVDEVEADIDQAERRGGVAEPQVEIRGDGHEVILLR